MRAIILAADKNFPAAPSAGTPPKAMICVEGRPILEHVLNKLPDHIKEAVIILGHRGEIIRRHFGSTYQGKELYYVWQYWHGEIEGALERAKKMFRNSEFLLIDIENIKTAESAENFLSS